MATIGVDIDVSGLAAVAQHAGWWWAFSDMAILTDRPDLLRRDAQGRLHSGDGPALRYRDGWAIHAWHGVRVPVDLIEGRWTLDQAMREPNSEIRRCAIEVMAGRDGWGRIVADAGWDQVGDDVADPGNPGQVLSLYHIPQGLYEQPIRLLLCTNATRERDGSRHEFGLTVPADITDPVAAAAWTFNLNPSTYRALRRAC